MQLLQPFYDNNDHNDNCNDNNNDHDNENKDDVAVCTLFPSRRRGLRTAARSFSPVCESAPSWLDLSAGLRLRSRFGMRFSSRMAFQGRGACSAYSTSGAGLMFMSHEEI